MNAAEFAEIQKAVDIAVDRVIDRGADDVFRPPVFSHSIEHEVIRSNPERFREQARKSCIAFLNAADLRSQRIGLARRGFVCKDANTFRQVAWLDPFDAVKYLSVAIILFQKIEAARIKKDENIIHSHRQSEDPKKLFDESFGYDSFRTASSKLSKENIGKWKVVTDVANFFDRVGNHSLENHLLDLGCEKKYVELIREILYFWAGDRRSFGVPVGLDASRILSEAVLIDIDRKLKNSGITFVRYVDDYRIFCECRASALSAIQVLTALLAEEGLAINSKKTQIFKILDDTELAELANRFAPGEHEAIDLDEKVEVKTIIRASGRSSIAKFYREPGKEALKKIKAIQKKSLFEKIEKSNDEEFEQICKLCVKYFVYADQDVNLICELIRKRITSVFYISDALTKECDKFSARKCDEIVAALISCENWKNCAFPVQVPIIRIFSHEKFADYAIVRHIVDSHKHTDNMLFFREVISLGYQSLDRPRLRMLAIDMFPNVPDFVQRAIFRAVKEHGGISEEEKRPLLRNMQQAGDDWFIKHMA